MCGVMLVSKVIHGDYILSVSYSQLFLSSFVWSYKSNKSASVPTLCPSTSNHTLPFSLLSETLHHWDITSVNWDSFVVKSWWCNVPAENGVSINQPEMLEGYAVATSLHTQSLPWWLEALKNVPSLGCCYKHGCSNEQSPSMLWVKHILVYCIWSRL